MQLPALVARSTRRLLPLFAVALFVAVLIGPAAVQATDTSSTTVPGQSAVSPTTTVAPGQGPQLGQTAVVPPPAGQVPLNVGWKTDQMDVRVMPEYDQKAVLVIMGFSLPAYVSLPATLKFAVPAGAKIAGIGEVDPNGNFTYNYTTSYPPVEPGAEWDVATIEVKNYRQLQIDYYYDPGLPQGAGQRSFPLLAQMPMDAGTLLLHVQQPARATDFTVQPAMQGSGQAEDGFTYAVAAYPDVKAGSTLGHVVSYYKPDGGLSTDSAQSGTTQVNTNTVLLVAILIIVVFIGGIVVYRLYFKSPKADPKKGRAKGPRSQAATPPPATTKQQRQGTKPAAPAKTTTPKAAAAADAPTSTYPATEQGDSVVEYCNACGEELTTNSPFCPNCGEARS
jgi:hypothetical protein